MIFKARTPVPVVIVLIAILDCVVSSTALNYSQIIESNYTRNKHFNNDDDIRIETTGRLKFRFVPVMEEGCFSVLVKTPEDITISLSNAAQYIDPKYAILIGGWSNTLSAIVFNENYDSPLTKTNTPGICSADEYRRFYVKWSQDGHIWVGKNEDPHPFLVYKFPKKEWYPINFVGVTSGYYEIDASWIIDRNPVCP